MRKEKKKWSMQTDAVMLLTVSFAVLVLLFFFSFRVQVDGLVEASQADSLLHKLHVLESALREHVGDMPETAAQWAARPSVAARLEGREDELEEDILTENPFMQNQLSLIALADQKGQAVYHQGFDYDNFEYIALSQEMLQVFSKLGRGSAAGPEASVLQGFLRRDGQVYYICSAPVAGTGGGYAGAIITGRLIDADLLRELAGESVTMSFSVLSELELDKSRQETLQAKGELLLSRGRTYAAYYSVTDLFEEEVLLVCLTSAMPYFQGIQVVIMMTMLLAGLAVLIVVLVIRRSDKALSQPLELLGESLGQVELETFSAPLEPTGRTLEESRLTESINQMLMRAKTDRQMIVESRDLMFYMANYDSLTYLFNRFSSQTALNERIETARENGQPITIFFVDINKFKNINDSMGHDVGDKLILTIAERMREGFPPDTLLARMGGDDFMIAGVESPDQPSFFEVIQGVFETPFVVKEREISLQSSIGCSRFPQDGEDAEALIKNAEIAMYRAKELKEDRFVIYREEFQEALQKNIEIENRMRRVIAEGCNEFAVFLQPKATIENGEIIRCEALIRWFAKTGMVRPDDFIPQAEDSGLIVPLSWWLIRECCRIGRKLQDLRKPHIISINIPAQVLLHKDFLSVIREAVEESGVDIRLLDIEITESTLLNDMERVNEVLKTLHQMGTEVSIDDFGTGYSSLSYLSKLAVDRIKIDRAFVNGIDQDEESRDIVRAIVAMAKSLKMVVTAEGVENWEQFAFLSQINCEEAQGYYICRPISNDDYYPFVRDWDKDKLISGNL